MGWVVYLPAVAPPLAMAGSGAMPRRASAAAAASASRRANTAGGVAAMMHGAMAGCLATIGRCRCSSSSGATKAALATVRPTNMAVLNMLLRCVATWGSPRLSTEK